MSETLPLFPLGTVLYPGLLLPLHIFEDRYRQLVHELLDGPGPQHFGVIAIREGRETGVDSISSVYEIGCTAMLRQVREHEDGRFDLVTVGTQRFRLGQFDDSRPYLQGEVELLGEDTGDPATADLAARAVQRAFRLFQRGLRRGQLVQPDGVLERQVTDLVRGQAADHDRLAVVGGGQGGGPGRGDYPDQCFALRGADADRLDRVACDELRHRAVGDELAPADHQEMVGGVLHLRHQVAGHEDRTAFRGQRLHQVPDPPDALRVQAIDRLIEHEDGRVAEQRRGNAEPLAHAERETLRPFLRHLAQPDKLQN